PNREVKPASADGTATPSGRVGRRLSYKSPFTKCEGAFFMGCTQGFYLINLFNPYFFGVYCTNTNFNIKSLISYGKI
ncbi:hypothetical protein ACFOUT_19280, partial [Euzebyella saccharophila]